MIRRLRHAALALALLSTRLAGQLPLITVPSGALRIDVAGAFYPSNDVWDNGSRRPIGDLLSGSSNGMISSLQVQLAQALGHPVTGLTLGSIGAVAAREHGVGDLGLAYGVSRRITIFGTLPIVFVHTRLSTSFGPASSRVGINPAAPGIGTPSGAATTANFFSAFDAALSALTANIHSGAYASDPAQLALAQQTLTSATAMRGSLFTLLADSAHASAVLPASSDPLALQLIGGISALQGTLATQLGVTGFTQAPALPDGALTADDFDALLTSSGGFGYSLPNGFPHYGIGDMTAGVAVQLFGNASSGTSPDAWVRVTGRFPTAAVANPAILLAESAGSPDPAVTVDGIVQLAHGRLGLRAEASMQHEFPASALARLAAGDAVLVPASFLAAVKTQPGDSIAITARPFLRFAPHLALAGMLQYWRRGASSSNYLANQAPIPGVDPSILDTGSAANAFVVALGLAYSHDGTSHEGQTGLPVEAGWSIERTVASGAGIFPAALTSRVYLRIYRPLFSR